VNPERDAYTSRRIEILREDVSRKIAAGEVIDRPFSVVRELLDNAIDAGAGKIDLYIEGGGISRIRVVDDGEGMSREDLGLCTQRHATSKIREEGDLYRIDTLGFRGEALASMAVCSHLEIVSRQAAGEPQGASEPQAAAPPAYRLRIQTGRQAEIEPCQGNPGTVVTVSDLFYNLPVRRKFLKSTSAETGLCRQAFLEKAVPHPDLSFRLFVDGSLRSFLPPQPLEQRAAGAFALASEHFRLLQAGQERFRLRIVAARPELNRRDKRLIQIYVNRRRIYEYGLIHAVEYAYSGYLPGGRFPAAFVFLELDPELVDFNIHPAKREARFRDLSPLHQAIVAVLKAFLRDYDLRVAIGPEAGSGGTLPHVREAALPFAGPQGPELPEEAIPRFSGVPIGESKPSVTGEGRPAVAAAPVYLGQLFRLFLLVEYGASLYIIDQHAAHERILFEDMSSRRLASQELLMPLRIELGEEARGLIAAREELLRELGVRIEQNQDGAYEIAALPEELLGIEEEELVKALLLEEGSLVELKQRVYSLAACRLAVKEGERLDPLAASELVRRVFSLANARCPHGRPIWHEVRRGELLRAVQRE
jgi:DNA mismatch repair protein MutL